MLKRYVANKNAPIFNSYDLALHNRLTGSNAGKSDVLPIYSIYGQVSSGSSELARALYQFPIDTISTDRTNGVLPASGSVSFYLRLFNVKHAETLPRQYTLTILPLSRSWTQGDGTDIDNGLDLGAVNWISASNNILWTNPGGDYLSSSVYNVYFDKGYEDLSVDISSLVEQWIAGTVSNNGVGIMLSSSYESTTGSYYVKKFFGEGSEYFYSRPRIEARWDDVKKDRRGSFTISSSLASGADNLNTIYLYNLVRGQLKNIPSLGSTGSIFVKVYSSLSGSEEVIALTPNYPVTGGWASTGIYSASFAIQTTSSILYDRWYSGSVVYHTGSFRLQRLEVSNINPTAKYVTSVTNLKPIYFNEETARFRLFTREKDWQPTIYTVANANIENTVVEDAYYRVYRVIDNLDVIPYGTGSGNQGYTHLSYDTTGSYFDLDMTLLEKDYQYRLAFNYYINGKYQEQKEKFLFRVE